MPTQPKVSFLALCFNHAPYLRQCLDSIAAQNWPHAELIILDNASADASATIIRDWARTSPIPTTLLLETERRGICANVNRMLTHATGDFFALISTDDYWLPGKTASQVNTLSSRGDKWSVAYSEALCIDEAGNPLPDPFIRSHRSFDELPSGDILAELLRGPFIPAMSSLVRRSALAKAGSYDESLIYEDYDMWIRLATDGYFHADPDPLCAYRILNSSLIRTAAAQDQPAKALSDLRIMAKACRIQRLSAESRKNTARRTINLAIRLASMSGNWSQDILAAGEICDLDALVPIAAAASLTPRPTSEAIGTALAGALAAGWLNPSQIHTLPRSITQQTACSPPDLSNRTTPATTDFTAWLQILPALLYTESQPLGQRLLPASSEAPSSHPGWEIPHPVMPNSPRIHPAALCESNHVGPRTRIWAFTHILPNAVIGADCNVCDHVFIENDVVIGDRVTIKCGVQLWDSMRIEDDVFIGPNATFCNDRFPRSKERPAEYLPVILRKGASIGANATILPGIEIGTGAMVAAGAVVTRSVPPHTLVAGNPARIIRSLDNSPDSTNPGLTN
jgi:acetyltransferase-like isoleucine patch superfamily enzyme